MRHCWSVLTGTSALYYQSHHRHTSTRQRVALATVRLLLGVYSTCAHKGSPQTAKE